MLAVSGNKVSLLRDGAACFDAMFSAIAEAREEILLEMYWFGSDTTGRRFAAALAARAKEGLRVCVTYDAIGSWEASRSMFQAMAADGCLLYEFNPPRRLRKRLQLNLMQRRNHRKLLIVDGRVGFTGGVNLGDAWAPLNEGGIFHDDMIRVEGPATANMRQIFLHTFDLGTRHLQGATDRSPKAWREAWKRPLRSRARSRSRLAHPARASIPDERGESLRVLTNEGLRRRRVIELAYLAAIRRAQRSVLIVNSYFIPRWSFRRALADAVRRGVEVKVLVPGVSDVTAAAFASRRLYSGLMRNGIHIYEWQASTLHSKIAAVDDRWCTVGTHNLDYRSFFYNLEVNVVIESEPVATALADHIRSDLALSARVDPDAWRCRPLVNRLLELFFYRFRRLL